jgi:cytochrome P450
MLLSADLLDTSDDVGNAITTLMNFAIDEQRDPLRAVLSLPRALPALLFLNRTLYRRIEERRRNGEGEAGDEADLLSRLLFATDDATGGPYMSDRLIRDEAMTIFLAGLETVAMSLTWSSFFWQAMQARRNAQGQRWMPLWETGTSPTFRTCRVCRIFSRSSRRRCACIRPRISSHGRLWNR